MWCWRAFWLTWVPLPFAGLREGAHGVCTESPGPWRRSHGQYHPPVPPTPFLKHISPVPPTPFVKHISPGYDPFILHGTKPPIYQPKSPTNSVILYKCGFRMRSHEMLWSNWLAQATIGSGHTGLMLAVQGGHTETATMLLGHKGTDTEAQDSEGYTALIIAACQGQSRTHTDRGMGRTSFYQPEAPICVAIRWNVACMPCIPTK